jgi:hypothetical protein
MPADNRLGLNDMRSLSPSRPYSRYEDPEESIGVAPPRPGMCMFENGELLTQDSILEGQILPAPEHRSQRSNNDSKPFEHDQNTNRTLQEKAAEST